MTYSPKPPPPRKGPEFQDIYDYIDSELQSLSRALIEVEEASESTGPTITVGTTAPSSPAVNDLWVDTN
jgi:hypothetical protein